MNTEIIAPVPNFSICQYDFFPIRPNIIVKIYYAQGQLRDKKADLSLTLALYPKPRGQSQEKYAIRTMEQNKNDDSKQNHQNFYIPNTISVKTKNLLMTG